MLTLNNLHKKKKFNFRLDFGIGVAKYKLILLKLGLNFNHGFYKFFNAKINIIKRYKLILIVKRWLIIKRLKYRLKQYLTFYKKVKNYKFLRFKFGLPVNGQRTHTNRKNAFKGLMVRKIEFSKNFKKNKYKKKNFNMFKHKQKIYKRKK